MNKNNNVEIEGVKTENVGFVDFPVFSIPIACCVVVKM